MASYCNFSSALLRLKEAAVERNNNTSDVIRDGVIQRFEFTYELAWKTTKEYLKALGLVDKTSPKAVIKEAYAQKLITNEKMWLLMLNDRNLTSHVYKEKIVEEIAQRIVNDYIILFESLLANLLET
ncbi:MAG: nucleotidyltransferase substrate binding protein [Ruminiclostridium sp.]